MSGRWAAALELSQARLLGPLRLWPGIEACAVADTVWLHAMSFDSALDAACQRLPGATRYQVFDDGQLLPTGALVPLGYLPVGDWTPLDRWLGVSLPLAQRSAGHAPPVRLQLVRSTAICRPTILRPSPKSWVAFVERAPQLRLGCLSFLASRDGQVLVRGNPLPPLPGEQFCRSRRYCRSSRLELAAGHRPKSIACCGPTRAGRLPAVD